MNYNIRIIKTGSDRKAVQVINYFKRKTIILKHIGSGNGSSELDLLKKKAVNWIAAEINQKGLFHKSPESQFKDRYRYLGFTYMYAYEFLEKIYFKFNFHKFFSEIFKDLVLARILEPASKKSSLEFLLKFLDKDHSLNALYKTITKYDQKTKDHLEKEIVEVAKKEFGFDFSFVLYDVTTLYFESFKDDQFKRAGFSKDNKSNQPQIVIGLIVSKEGFPINYQIFRGNTFEGNTFLPTILDFKKRHDITSLTIVADSAMFSKINLEHLAESGLNYIVAARLANLKQEILKTINRKIKRIDRSSIRLEDLIVDYSSKRYNKDRKDLDKQIEKARKYLNQETFRSSHIKYLKYENSQGSLNEELILKNTKLLGLKGYITNLKLSNRKIINYYHNLYKIEHAFRIAKSDLEARPIYHFKEESIKNHILICFLALTISIYLELKNKISIYKIVDTLKDITDGKILDKYSNRIIYERKKMSNEAQKLEKLSY